MIDLSTNYLGINLRNPIIVASSGMTSSAEKIAECEKAGAGAVVIKSLFEEQINLETAEMMKSMDYTAHTDAFDYFTGTSKHQHIDEYVELIESAKSRVSIPVIGSVNCISPGSWMEYAGRLEKAGIDALEVNVFIMPADAEQDSSSIEDRYIAILREIKRHVSVPVSLKIGPHFSGLANVIKRFENNGANGVVLFNRFYRPDVDIENMKIIPAKVYSVQQEISLSLQWIALLSGELDIHIAAATGIHDGKGVIKQLLVGARATQLCSTLYRNGISHIQRILVEVEEWMNRHNFKKIEDFRGKLSRKSVKNPEIFERSQYIRALVGIS